MSELPPALPHGRLEEVLSGVFFVTGTTRPKFMGKQWQFSRNMTVLCEGDSLTLVNTVRLDDAGLAALDALGKVEHVVKLGAFHGLDDAFYVGRYQAALWALPGMEHEHGLETTHPLTVGGATPVTDASLFVFETSSKPEGVLLVDRDGGILISCDSLQNWVEPDEYFDEPSAKMMGDQGFFRPANVGPGWKMSCEPKADDFARLKRLSFRHLLSAHGVPLKDQAHQQLSATFADLYGV